MKTKLFTFLVLATLLSVACRATATPMQRQSPSGLISATQTPVTATTHVPNDNTEITISGFMFDPSTVTISVGMTVTWTNLGSSDHTIVADDGSWKSESLAQNESFSFTFDKAGTYTYICGIHPTMKGTIIVK